jgi:hypothetical protein
VQLQLLHPTRKVYEQEGEVGGCAVLRWRCVIKNILKKDLLQALQQYSCNCCAAPAKQMSNKPRERSCMACSAARCRSSRA